MGLSIDDLVGSLTKQNLESEIFIRDIVYEWDSHNHMHRYFPFIPVNTFNILVGISLVSSSVSRIEAFICDGSDFVVKSSQSKKNHLVELEL